MNTHRKSFNVIETLLPKGSKRRLIAKLFRLAMVNPGEAFININPVNLKKFFSYLKADEIMKLEEKLDQRFFVPSSEDNNGTIFIQNRGYCNCCDNNIFLKKFMVAGFLYMYSL